MRKFLIIVMIIVVIVIADLIFMYKGVGGGRSEWDKAYTEGNILYEKKDYVNAIPYYDKSIEELNKLILKNESNRDFLYQVLVSKASCFQKMGEGKQAILSYQEVIEEYNKRTSSNDKSMNNFIQSYVGTAIVNQGLIYLDSDEDLARKKFEEALEFFQCNQETIMPGNLKQDIQKVIEYYNSKNETDMAKKFEDTLPQKAH